MKKLLFSAMILSASVLSFTACNNNSDKPEDSKEVAKEVNEQKFDSSSIEDDTKFAVNAADAGMAEVMLAKLALEKSKNKDVIALATMMKEEHMKANEELKAAAMKKNITLPDSASENKREKYDKLAEKTGTDFDKEYADHMVSAHKDVIDLFKKEAEKGNDPELKAWAADKLSTLEHHLQMSEATKESLKDKK